MASSPLPQHGFARINKWEWLGTVMDTPNEVSVQFGMS